MDPFVAEIRLFPGNFAPKGWALCQGQLLAIAQNTTLFSLLGTFYGGDGRSTFGLPNLQGAVAVNAGQTPGLSEYSLGQTGGAENVTLQFTDLPSHSHALQGTVTAGNTGDPSNAVWAKGTYGGQGQTGAVALYTTAAPSVSLNLTAVNLAGGDQPHNNMMPYLALNYIIALQGIYPARS